MYEHIQKTKFKLNQFRFEKISKNFQSPVQVNWVWKNFKKFQSPTPIKQDWKNFNKFSKSSSSQLGLKNFQKTSKFNSSKTWMKKFLSFKCLVEKLKSFENIPSPNQKMAEPRKISKFQTQKSLSEKNSRINSKFRLAEIFSNFFKIFSVQHWSLWDFNVYTRYLGKKKAESQVFLHK